MTFDQIDPAHMTRAECAALLAEAMALQGKLLARLLADLPDGFAPTTRGRDDDRLLTLEQACELLACSRSYLYHHHKHLGIARKLGDGSLRFSSAAIQRLIKHDGRKLRRIAESEEP